MWVTRVSINNPVFATMVMVALCVLGLFAYMRVGVEQLPDVAPPVAFIDVLYPGASPEAVEREISKVVEEALNSIAGVKRIMSRSFEGRSQTSVEFTLNADMSRAMQDVRDRIAAVQSSFPEDAKAPTVARFDNENSQPTVVMALLSKTRSARELSQLADQVVSKRLQRVEGVARVDISGMTTREVRIDLDAVRLRAYGITPAEISRALKEANADQPVGLLSDPTQDALLRVEGRVRDPKQFADVVVARRAGLPLTLGDLGQLVEREREPDTLARINGQSAVTFNVHKQQDANIVATGDALKAAMDDVRKTLPTDTELRLVYANSDFVKNSLNGLQRTLVEGALLTVAIVFLFLHSWRSTVITGLTLPIAVISSFIAVYAFGFTLNFMTMMALSLCIGLLIDDAIVVRENIVRHVAMGKDHHTAAREWRLRSAFACGCAPCAARGRCSAWPGCAPSTALRRCRRCWWTRCAPRGRRRRSPPPGAPSRCCAPGSTRPAAARKSRSKTPFARRSPRSPASRLQWASSGRSMSPRSAPTRSCWGPSRRISPRG